MYWQLLRCYHALLVTLSNAMMLDVSQAGAEAVDGPQVLSRSRCSKN